MAMDGVSDGLSDVGNMAVKQGGKYGNMAMDGESDVGNMAVDGVSDSVDSVGDIAMDIGEGSKNAANKVSRFGKKVVNNGVDLKYFKKKKKNSSKSDLSQSIAETEQSIQSIQSKQIKSGNIHGCIYPEALNYNPDATFDDGSCSFQPQFNQKVYRSNKGSGRGPYSIKCEYNYLQRQ